MKKLYVSGVQNMKKNAPKFFTSCKIQIFPVFAKIMVFGVSKNVSEVFNTLQLPPKKFGDEKNQKRQKYWEKIFGVVKNGVGVVNLGHLPPHFFLPPHFWILPPHP